ncbi:MAG: Tagatose-bisphosphate aldolase [Phycisphaerales bacterium]|nr:Tagatose-bisphosphate aldolase [Phycisphaerales bacterium]
MPPFPFLTPSPLTFGPLRDGELSLRLTAADVTDDVPAYSFAIQIDGVPADVGMIRLRPQTTPHLEQVRGHIGYAIHEPNRGHHYAERAARPDNDQYQDGDREKCRYRIATLVL